MGARALVRTRGLDRLAWLEARRAGIGGSDAAAILGLSQWRSALDVWVEKTAGVVDGEASEAAYWGNVLENVVASEFQKQTGLRVRRRNFILQSEDHPFMIANIDREIVGERVGLECKTCSAYKNDVWADDEVPIEYIVQCQHYMAVTGYDAWWIAVLIGGNKFVVKQIERDEEIIGLLIEQEGAFWRDCVEGGKMPELDGSMACKMALGKLYPRSNGEVIALDSRARALLRERAVLKARQDAAEEKINLIEGMIKQQMGDYEIGEVDGYRVSWKSAVCNRLDSKLVREGYPDIYKECLKQSESRRFMVKEMEQNGD